MGRHSALSDGLIQVAGVQDEEEAGLLIEEAVDWIGIPLRLPVNAEDCSDAVAAAISRRYPNRCCLITYLDKARDIIALVRELQVTLLQLHGDVDTGIIPEVRQAVPNLCIIKSLVIGRDKEDVLADKLRLFAPLVDGFITDTFDPATGAEGATGQLHDWAISERLCRISPRPVILAGGLNPDNVFSAIRAVRPAGVDVHTGVENADGSKNRRQVRTFVGEAKRAFASD